MAFFGWRRQRPGRFAQRGPAPVYAPLPSDVYSETPDQILGSILHTWIQIDDLDDVELTGGAVSRVRNRVASGDPVQATALLMPIYDEDGWANGTPCITSTGTQWMLGALTTTLAEDSRPYFWVVGRQNAAPSSGVRYWFAVESAGAAAFTGIRVTSSRYQALGDTEDGLEAPTAGSVPLSTACRLVEYGMRPATTAKLALDGHIYNGTLTGPLQDENDRIALFAAPDGSSIASASLKFIAIATEIPADAQLTAMRNYVMGKRWVQ